MHKNIVHEAWRILYPILIFLTVEIIVETYFGRIAISQTDIDITYLSDEGISRIKSEYIKQNSLIITAINNAIVAPIFAIFVFLDRRKKSEETGIKYSYPKIKEYGLIFLLGMGAAISVNVIIAISGLAKLSPKYEEVNEIIYNRSLALQIISAAVIAPILEELLFRGLIFNRLRNYCNLYVAIGISSVFFGLIHGNLVQFVYATIIGILLAYVYEKYKTITIPIMLHMGANLLAVLVTYVLPESYPAVYALFAMIIGFALAYIILKHVNEYQIKGEKEK